MKLLQISFAIHSSNHLEIAASESPRRQGMTHFWHSPSHMSQKSKSCATTQFFITLAYRGIANTRIWRINAVLGLKYSSRNYKLQKQMASVECGNSERAPHRFAAACSYARNAWLAFG